MFKYVSRANVSIPSTHLSLQNAADLPLFCVKKKLLIIHSSPVATKCKNKQGVSALRVKN